MPPSQIFPPQKIEKGVAHIVYFKYQKQKQDSNQSEVLSTTANQDPGSVWSGTDAAVREQQKQDFGQNQDLVPSSP